MLGSIKIRSGAYPVFLCRTDHLQEFKCGQVSLGHGFRCDLDRELDDPRINNSIKREFVAILPTHLDNSREIKVLEHILDRHNLQDHSIEWLYRANTADPKKERKNTVVEMRWKPGEEPVVSYLNEDLNWENKSIVFTDKTRARSDMPPNRKFL